MSNRCKTIQTEIYFSPDSLFEFLPKNERFECFVSVKSKLNSISKKQFTYIDVLVDSTEKNPINTQTSFTRKRMWNNGKSRKVFHKYSSVANSLMYQAFTLPNRLWLFGNTYVWKYVYKYERDLWFTRYLQKQMLGRPPHFFSNVTTDSRRWRSIYGDCSGKGACRFGRLFRFMC